MENSLRRVQPSARGLLYPGPSHKRLPRPPRDRPTESSPGCRRPLVDNAFGNRLPRRNPTVSPDCPTMSAHLLTPVEILPNSVPPATRLPRRVVSFFAHANDRRAKNLSTRLSNAL